MNTKQMFKQVCADKNWMMIKPALRTQHRMSRSRFKSGKDISEEKMAAILKKLGYKMDDKGKWAKKGK